MRLLFEVTATKKREVKSAHGWITAPEGYLVYKAFQVASSEAEAIELAKMHVIGKFDSIRATFIRTD